MKIKITRKVRAALHEIIARSGTFDADSMVIHYSGEVSARLCPNKTFKAQGRYRPLVGYVDRMVTQDGQIREGY